MIRTPVAPLALAAVVSFAAVSATAQPADAPFVVAEAGRAYPTLQAAVDAVGEGKGTIRIGAGVHRQCAVQTQGVIAFVAATPGRAIFDGTLCENKAALVLRGQGATVDGIVFQNMHNPEGNAAGIRLEQRNLTVTNSMFRNMDDGILTADDFGSDIVVDRSTFSRIGRCDRGLSCAHSIYTGRFSTLTVTRSRFEKGTGGHYVKTRSVRVDIADNSFDDVQGTGTNYMIDLPSGAIGEIRRNVFVQGRDKENYSAFIAVAGEEKRNPSGGLTITDNRATIVPGVERNSTFVANWSGERVNLSGNSLGEGLQAYEAR